MEITYSLALWTFIIRCAFFVACSHIEDKSQVIGPSGPIIAAPGDDVLLPCHLEPPLNVQRMGLTVEWSRPDLKPDPSDRLSRVGYVHLYRDRREVFDMKIPSYIGRTQLFTDELKTGNISLRIINVTTEDSGRYRCFIPKLRSKVRDSIFELVVVSNLVKVITTETPLHPRTQNIEDSDDMTDVRGHAGLYVSIPVILSVILVIAAGVGGYLYKRSRHKKDLHKAPSGNLLPD